MTDEYTALVHEDKMGRRVLLFETGAEAEAGLMKILKESYEYGGPDDFGVAWDYWQKLDEIDTLYLTEAQVVKTWKPSEWELYEMNEFDCDCPACGADQSIISAEDYTLYNQNNYEPMTCGDENDPPARRSVRVFCSECLQYFKPGPFFE